MPTGLHSRLLAAGTVIAGATLVGLASPASAISVSTEAGLRAAFADGAETTVVLTADIDLTDCGAGDVGRPAGAAALTLSGPFEIHQTCAGARVIGSEGDTGELTIEGATISGGRLTDAVSATGGGIYWQGDLTLNGAIVVDNSATAPFGGLGGGMFVTGALVVDSSTITGNTAGSNGDFGALAGALSAGTSVLVTDSTLSDNTAEGGAEFGGTGGAVFGNSNVVLIRSTLTGNRALVSDDGTSGGTGGAVVINGALDLVNTTVSGNQATGADSTSGGVASGGDLTLVYSTIVGNSAASAANVQTLNSDPSFGVDVVFATVIANPLGGGGNCGASSDAVSEGYSFADDTSCNLTATGDQQGTTSPGLGALGPNGGPTDTHLPTSTSPLLDAIPSSSCQTGPAAGVDDDQRSVSRPQQAGCDIGAVEVTASEPLPTGPTTPGDPTAPGVAPGAEPVPASPRFTG